MTGVIHAPRETNRVRNTDLSGELSNAGAWCVPSSRTSSRAEGDAERVETESAGVMVRRVTMIQWGRAGAGVAVRHARRSGNGVAGPSQVATQATPHSQDPPPAEVRRSSKGAGLFATCDLRSETVVEHFEGPILALSLDSQTAKSRTYSYSIRSTGSFRRRTRDSQTTPAIRVAWFLRTETW